MSKALTWDELANIYDKSTGGRARTLSMDAVFNWAVKQTDRFYVSDEGTIHERRVK